MPSFFIYLILRLLGIKCSKTEVKKGKYIHDESYTPKEKFIYAEIDGQLLLEQSKEIYSELERRRSQLNHKGQSMLTIGGLMIPIVGFLVSISPSIIFQLIYIILLLLILVLLVHLNRIIVYTIPVIDEDILNQNKKENAYKLLAWDYYLSFKENNRSLDYLIDVLKASYRLLIVSIIVLCIGYLYNLDAPSNNEYPEVNNIIMQECSCDKYSGTRSSDIKIDTSDTTNSVSANSKKTRRSTEKRN